MKKILILGCMVLFALSCKAQTIVAVEKAIDYRRAGNGIPDNTYLKDVNNLLAKYVGTWKGTLGGKNYTFYVTKYTSKFDKVTSDELVTRYLITTSNGSIVEDTRNLPYTSPYVIKGDYFGKDLATYASNYFGKNSQCGNKGTVFFRMKNTVNTQMSLTFVPDNIIISEDVCPGLKGAELTFPKDDVIRFTKQ